VPSKQDNVQRGMLRDARNLDFQSTVRAISSRVDLGTMTEDYAARIDHDNAGVASAAVYHPSGVYLFVALETSREVAVVDAARKRELFRIAVGLAPQALVVGDDDKLFVLNALSRNVSVLNLVPLTTRGERMVPETATLSSVAVEKLPASVLRGKQLFYDARDTRLARDGYVSCAACHNDGEDDGRTWDFTGFGEGLRNTPSLRGRGVGHGRAHWTGNFDEVQDFETQIRVLAEGSGLMDTALLAVGTRVQPLGDAKAGLSVELDALAAYLASLTEVDPSPHRIGGELTPAAEAGGIFFADNCSSCHGGVHFTDSATNALHDVGTLKPSSGTRLGAALLGIDTPGLRDAWATAPYLHDGSAPTLEAAIQAHTGLSVPAAALPGLVDYVRQLGNDEIGFAP
jgi:mono/diheme cytochrome c family protein